MDDIDAALHALYDCLAHLPERDLGALFSPSFLAQTPEPLLRTRLEYMLREFGVPTETRVDERLSPRSAHIHVRFARGYAARGDLVVDEERPVRVQWLRFDLPTREVDSWAAIDADVRALPGRTSFAVRNLSSGTTLATVHPDLALGVGSVSKLAIFSALLDDVATGVRNWTDVLVLDDRDRSHPTGILHDWPSGAPLTLHTAATVLLALSDNTAADLLLRVIGRDRVEAIAGGLSPDGTAGGRPFLSTRGLFALVGGPDERRRAWLAADEAARRTLLADAEAEPLVELAQVTGAWPDDFDWTWSAADVLAILDRLRMQLGPIPAARSLLTINRGLGIGDWPFWGFKGGSSAGRMAFAVLLEHEGGEWFGIALANNTAPEALRPEAIVQLVKRAADQLRA